MPYISGTKLAVLQDTLIGKYLKGEKPTDRELRDLSDNSWVTMATKLAPGNLPLRNYCLVDLLINKNPANKAIVGSLFYKVGKAGDNQIMWAEGYSYWLYVKVILTRYMEAFGWSALIADVQSLEQNFAHTAYRKNDMLYPAPFGDLRDIPLESHLQSMAPREYARIGNVLKDRDTYTIFPRPMKMNVHTPKETSRLYVEKGRVRHTGTDKPYHFYEGYDKKYPNKLAEIADCMDPRRWK